jgi:hypothetical protein
MGLSLLAGHLARAEKAALVEQKVFQVQATLHREADRYPLEGMRLLLLRHPALHPDNHFPMEPVPYTPEVAEPGQLVAANKVRPACGDQMMEAVKAQPAQDRIASRSGSGSPLPDLPGPEASGLPSQHRG